MESFLSPQEKTTTQQLTKHQDDTRTKHSSPKKKKKQMQVQKIIKSTSFLAICSCLLWATPFTAIKIGLQYTTPLHFAGLRFFISGLLILPFIPNIKKEFQIAKKQTQFVFGVALLQTTLLYGLFYTGIDHLPGALGAMIIGAQPLFAAIMAHLLLKDDKMSKQKLFAILIGMLGVCIISLGRSDFVLSSTIPLGVSLLILNNIVGSTGNVIVAKDKGKIPPKVLASFSMIIGGVGLMILSVPIEDPQWLVINPKEYYFSLAWLAIVSSISITTWFGLLKRPGVKVSNLNTWKFIIPIFGASFSWLILPGENPDLLSISGMMIIALSLLVLNFINKRTIRNTNK